MLVLKHLGTGVRIPPPPVFVRLVKENDGRISRRRNIILKMSQFQAQASVLQTRGRRQYILILLLTMGILFGACPAYCTDYYVAPDGNDSNDGSIDHPFKTIGKAVGLVVAGDTIYVRGGVYTYSGSNTAITLPAKSGASATNRCYLLAYQNERPLLDFSAMTGTGADGLKINGSYWYLKGIDFKGAPHNGIKINGNGIIGAAGSYNIVEFCSSYENRNTGVQLGNKASYNQIINCDSYYNCDAAQEDADGFSPKLDVGTDNYFYGCRSWQNSDDGYDGYLRDADDVTTTYENCWSFKNGYLKSGAASGGDGQGFKMGGSDDKTLKHNAILKNCLSFSNRVKGFDQNNDKGSITLYNCTAFSNGTNYSISSALASGKTATVTNCVSAGTGGVSLGSFVVQTTNSWMSPFVVTNADFASIVPSAAYGARNADGSLPNIAFMRLATGSDLIDGGTDVGLPYNGSAPDLGAFEHLDGDSEPDGDVDWADLGCLASNWLDVDCGDCNGADFDGNGDVDLYDFAVMAGNWLKY
jgi:hypothetical protein